MRDRPKPFEAAAARGVPPSPRRILSPPGCLRGEATILGRLCQAFGARLLEPLKAVREALWDRDEPQLCKAAHEMSGMVAAVSTAANDVAAQLEDHAAQGELDQARPLAERLGTTADELMLRVDGLSLGGL